MDDYRHQVDSLQAQLDEAHADIRDFTESSKELQDELEKELGRLEKGERDMRRSLEHAAAETDEWKVSPRPGDEREAVCAVGGLTRGGCG